MITYQSLVSAAFRNKVVRLSTLEPGEAFMYQGIIAIFQKKSGVRYACRSVNQDGTVGERYTLVNVADVFVSPVPVSEISLIGKDPTTYEADAETAWAMAHREERGRFFEALADKTMYLSRVQGLWDRGVYIDTDVAEAGLRVSRSGQVFDPEEYEPSFPRWGENEGYVLSKEVAEYRARQEENRRNADDTTETIVLQLKCFNVSVADERQMRDFLVELTALADKLPNDR